MSKKVSIIILVIVLIGVGAYFLYSGGQSGVADAYGTKVGNKAPPFSVSTIDGKTIIDSELRGNVVVITSSAAWCATCVVEAQNFAPVYEAYKDEPVVFLTIDIDPRNSKEFIDQFRRNNNTPWDYTDAEGASKLIRDYKLNRFEITYVIDKNGVIRHKDGNITSTENLTKIIKQTL